MYVEWIRFLLFLDRIDQSSLKLHFGTQDYWELFSPAARGFPAEGRIILMILRAGA
jgi:hypothetical protein